MKRLVCLCVLSAALVFAGCGNQTEVATNEEANEETSEVSVVSEAEKTATVLPVKEEKPEPKKVTFSTELDLSNRIIYGDGYVPERVYAGDEEWGDENPFSMYDGYYSYCDANAYGCYVRIQDGFVYFETRGEMPEDVVTEMYVENNHPYVEFDGGIIQLGKKDMYTLEYAPAGAYFPSYITAIPDEYAEDMYIDMVQRIKDNKQAMDDRIKAEAEARREADAAAKKAEEEAAAAKKAEEEAAKKAEEERQAKMAEKRSASGWTKAKVSQWCATQGYTCLSIEIIESNLEGVNSGDIITFEGTDGMYDPCTDRWGELLTTSYCGDGFQSGGGNGVSFEIMLSTHSCGNSGYVISDIIG